MSECLKRQLEICWALSIISTNLKTSRKLSLLICYELKIEIYKLLNVYISLIVFIFIYYYLTEEYF